MSELIEHNEMIIIIIQAFFLIISEVMPFLNNNKHGIVDGLVKIYQSECFESPEEIPIHVYGLEDAQNSLDANS